MEQRLYPVARIAEACGVSRQGLNKFCRERCPDAKVGTKLNINHPIVRAYMESKGADMERLKPAEERGDSRATTPVSQSESKLSKSRRHTTPSNDRPKMTATTNKTVEEIDISDHGNLTLNELIAYFGSDESYRGWLMAKKTQTEIVERELKVHEKKGELISRDFVSKAVFGLIEEFTTRLLVDSSVSIATKVFAHCESGDSIEEATETVRNEISKPLKGAKAKITKNIKGGN